MKRDAIVQFICYYFLLLFAYAALSKLFMYSTFLSDLGRAPVTQAMPLLYSILVPIMELTIATLVINNKTRSIGLVGAFLLMLIFTIYVGYVLNMTTERPCSCGGIFRNMTWRNHLRFNIISTVIAGIGVLLDQMLSRKINIVSGHINMAN